VKPQFLTKRWGERKLGLKEAACQLLAGVTGISVSSEHGKLR